MDRRLLLLPVLLLFPLAACAKADDPPSAPAQAGPQAAAPTATTKATTTKAAPPATEPTSKAPKVHRGSVIRFDIDANRIMKLDEIYLP